MNRNIHYIHFESIHSTNTWAKEHLLSLDKQAITCITADHQTAGRGQFDKKWVSPKEVNLYATLCFYESSPCLFLPNLAQLLSISTCKALENLGFTPQIKWPNDILLTEKKVGGILCEPSILSDLTGVILGIGLNINMSEEALLEINQPATSLYLITKQIFSVHQVLEMVLAYFLPDLAVLSSQGFSSFLSYYESHLAYKNQPFMLKRQGEVIQTTYKGLSPEGKLYLLFPCQTLVEVHSKELLE